jgi:hypothetical protein
VIRFSLKTLLVIVLGVGIVAFLWIYRPRLAWINRSGLVYVYDPHDEKPDLMLVHGELPSHVSINTIPLWLVGVIVIALAVAIFFSGFVLACKRQRK